ncbi:MAG: RNA chaperone Hfq [Nitrospirota bacterium]|nr:RNA chaperone Hfq [Nitrospirota bacterium]
MEAVKHVIEPQYLAQALAQGVTVRIGQMNKTEHEGIIREIGRYEINVEEQGGTVTILKQDISYIHSPRTLIQAAPPMEQDTAANPEHSASMRPNVQQEFLDKAIRERHVLTLFLLTGQRVKTVIENYDNFTLLTREGEQQHLYYKHGVSTINR